MRRHLTDLIDGLDKNKFKIILIYNKNFADQKFLEWLSANQQNDNVTFININNFVRELNLFSDVKVFLSLYKLIKMYNPDIVHTHSSKAGILGRLAAKMAKVKKIFYTPHAYSFLSSEFTNHKKKFFILLEKYFSRYSTTRTFNVSESEKDAALKNNIDSTEKFIVIPNAIPSLNKDYRVEARRLLNINEEKYIIGNIARITEQKNPELFINIAEEILKKDKSIEFYWIGSGNLDLKIQNKMSNLLKRNIHFVGEKSNADLLVSAYDLYLTTSIFEGFPYSLLEAANAQIPVFYSNVPGNVDFGKLYPNSMGFALESSIEDIANRIVLFIKSREKVIKSESVIKFNYCDMINEIQNQYLS